MRAAASTVLRAPAYLAAGLVLAYRYSLGALFPATCKYHPSCSQYALEALRRFGLIRGVILTGWRLLRCNPWSLGGVDRPENQQLFRAAGQMSERVDRSFQEDARAKPARPEGDTASGALGGVDRVEDKRLFKARS